MSLLKPALSLHELLTVRKQMRGVDAASPATAKGVTDLPPLMRSDLARCLELGVVEETTGGRYYLVEARTTALLRGYILRTAIFWFLVIITPVALMQFATSR